MIRYRSFMSESGSIGGSSVFYFQRFSVRNEASAMKVGTDAVLLGAYMTLLPSDHHLLDIGTGTGVIALLAAQRLEEMGSGAGAGAAGADFRIEAIDIDGPSAREAAANFADSPWGKCLSARHISLQEYSGALFDCIFSNPPYFDDSLKNPSARLSIARHTSELSWREICAFAASHLTPEGRLSLVLPATCEKMLLRTAASFGLHAFRIVRIQTTPRKPPLRIIAEFSFARKDVVEQTVNLQEPNETWRFTRLGELRDSVA